MIYSGQRGREMGQDVLYITERCVMRLGNKGLIAMEIMPGIEAETDIVQASDGLVTIADNATAMDKSILSTKLMGLKL